MACESSRRARGAAGGPIALTQRLCRHHAGLSQPLAAGETLFRIVDTSNMWVLAEVYEQDLGLVWLTGELSNLAMPSSGHWYFSLKDLGAQVRCAMFRRAASLLDFSPRDGQLVEVRGWIEGLGWQVQGIVESPIKGPEGNVEFLIAARRG